MNAKSNMSITSEMPGSIFFDSNIGKMSKQTKQA